MISAMPDRARNVTQDILADLWRRQLDTLITGIANGNSYYLQIANAAEHISAEHQGRFLIELIQNANDQAVREGLTNSFVSITRTDQLIAVGNSGQPFDTGKVDSITAIFQSDKPADVCIGNKGIGFKAVFQIADSAEIFSASAGSHLGDGPAIAFRMVRQPFANAAFVSDIRDLASQLLARDGNRKRAIEQRFAHAAPIDVVVREARRAAGFTFPLGLTDEQFAQRVSDLGLTAECLARTQTLVILQLNSPETTAAGVDEAIDEVCGHPDAADGMPPAASFLFLPGISSIDVVDRHRGFRAELRKSATAVPERSADGVSLRRQRTTSTYVGLDSDAAGRTSESQDWWVAERLIGDLDPADSGKGHLERERLREAIKTLRLPEENWSRVERVPVAIALPVPSTQEVSQNAGHPLGPHGRFCIGLPTLVPTGVPLWVSSHFHGKIDRTAIEFRNAYNGLLLSAAEDLAEALINRLKTSSTVTERRLVTLAMERASGVLAEAFYEDDGLARRAIVLAANDEFVEGSQLRMPQAADLPMFSLLTEKVDDIGAYGFCLPEAGLLANARALLDGLADGNEVEDDVYLRRPSRLPSLLEHAATVHRQSGAVFWERFLTWTLARFSAGHEEELAQLAILPTGEKDLSAPNARVFFRPKSVGAVSSDDEGAPPEEDETAQELAAIDDGVAALLRFFDESVIQVRTGAARDYTPLAQKLAPIAGGGLIRRPRQSDLINDALVPELAQCAADKDTDKALKLLRQALIWLVAMPPKSRARVSVDELRVPVLGAGERWEWRAPDSVYLGPGWLEDSSIDLLSIAYGNRPGSQLVPWGRFEKRARSLFENLDREWWRQRMLEIGVWDCPRVVSGERRPEVMRAYSRSQLTVLSDAACPIPSASGTWAEYLATLSHREAYTRSGQGFYLKEVTWIDGLENDAIRAVVVEAMLRKPDRYTAHQKTTLSRWNGENATTAPSLWVHALRTSNWTVIPTSHHGLRSPRTAWFLPLELRSSKADRFRFLPCVGAEYSAARGLLGMIGVVALDEAELSRLVDALHELAEAKDHDEPETSRHFSALVHDLYEALQVGLKGGAPADALGRLLTRPVPLLRGESIEAAMLQEATPLHVDDDPVRRRFLTGFDRRWVLPKRSHQSYSELIKALRTLLGDDNVRRVSECPVDVKFVAVETGRSLLDYLREAYPDRSIAEDMALLIVKGGTHATSPNEESFRQTWGQITRTRVIRGTLLHSAPHVSCFDAQHSGGPALLVDTALQPHEIVRELWQAVGPTYRDIWAAYADALKDGRTAGFFAERAVSPEDRTEVEAAIGLGFEQVLKRYQAVWLAQWRSKNEVGSLDRFHDQWAHKTRTVEVAREWLGLDNLAATVSTATQREEPAGSLFLLDALGLPLHAWQRARQELGDDPYRFEASERRYRSAREAVAGHVMALFAYLVVPRASATPGAIVPRDLAGSVWEWVKQIRSLEPPDVVAGRPMESSEVLSRLAADAVQAATAMPALANASMLVSPLRALASDPPTELRSIRLKDEPDKAATIYEVSLEEERAAQATTAVEDVLKVAAALAEKCGESVDLSTERDRPLVVLLSEAPWANRVSVLAAVRHGLEAAAPKTASRMKEQQAFRDFDDWRALWGKFSELGEIPRPGVPEPPKPRFDLLGGSWSEEEFRSAARQGPAGELFARLEESVVRGLDLSSLRLREREPPEKQNGPKPPGSRENTKSKKRDPEYLKMIGALGEGFVLQQLQAVLPDFDSTHWKSEARDLFKPGTGNDKLGYDFEYHDSTGMLTGGESTRRCLIEVKSSAEDRKGTFEMSVNEWEVARRCHVGEEDAVYVIIRVANVKTAPKIVDLLVDPIQLHLDGLLDYSSRDLLVAVGKALPASVGKSGAS